MSSMPNTIIETLIELGLSTTDSLRPFHPRVRDRNDIAVLHCARSGVLVLERNDHVSERTYANRDDLQYWGHDDRKVALRETFVDDDRRARLIASFVEARRWLDIGTGLGGILDLAGPRATAVAAVEPQAAARTALCALGYHVLPSLELVPDESFDLVTPFHVYEHIIDPKAFLALARRKLAPGGRIVIEVPHARDALLTQFDCSAFKDLTFWSEHLILHTRESLGRFMAAAGLARVRISGLQRYPLANHLHWLAAGRPGGHIAWDHLSDPDLDRRYELLLASLDMTDTLIAWGEIGPCDL